MSKLHLLASVCLALTSLAAAAQIVRVPAQDWRGAHDDPMISRFTGAVIISFSSTAYDELALPLDKYVKFDSTIAKSLGQSRVVAGQVTQVSRSK
jgi:hypothetical protein